MIDPVVLHPTALAIGGDAIARIGGGDEAGTRRNGGPGANGKVVFIDGALPGETVEVRFDDEKTDYSKATTIAVSKAVPERVEPTCPHVARGCGGCGWQFVDVLAQPTYKQSMTVDALYRTGRIAAAKQLVTLAPPLPAGRHRTTVRAMIVNGQSAFREQGSNRGVIVDSCEVTHREVEHVLVNGRFGRANEVTIRVGATTGDLLVVADPSASGVRLPQPSPEWTAIGGRSVVVGLDAVGRGSGASYREVIDGVEFRVSALSFFQTRPDGAEQLVSLLNTALADHHDVLIDLYGGVGLFAGTIGRRFQTVVSVEQEQSASDDAIVNLAHLDDANIVTEDVAEWRPSRSSTRGRNVAIIADPARKGLGRGGVGAIARLEPGIVLLVSCDLGSLGRDAKLLGEAGFELESSMVVDLFPKTPHVEVVSRFVPRGN